MLSNTQTLSIVKRDPKPSVQVSQSTTVIFISKVMPSDPFTVRVYWTHYDDDYDWFAHSIETNNNDWIENVLNNNSRRIQWLHCLVHRIVRSRKIDNCHETGGVLDLKRCPCLCPWWWQCPTWIEQGSRLLTGWSGRKYPKNRWSLQALCRRRCRLSSFIHFTPSKGNITTLTVPLY